MSVALDKRYLGLVEEQQRHSESPTYNSRDFLYEKRLYNFSVNMFNRNHPFPEAMVKLRKHNSSFRFTELPGYMLEDLLFWGYVKPSTEYTIEIYMNSRDWETGKEVDSRVTYLYVR